MKAVFVCGTDTGIGKTVVTGLIAKALQKNGKKVITQKWVQTGSKGFPLDIAAHLRIMDKPRSYVKGIMHLVNPYCFEFPASPHLAAKVESRMSKVESGRIKKAFKELTRRFDHVIVEGVGGALVPLNEKLLQLDLVKELKLPVILVVGNKLGAINHSLLTIEAIKKRKLKLAGIVFNDHRVKDKTIGKDNVRTISKAAGKNNTVVLPSLKNKNYSIQIKGL